MGKALEYLIERHKAVSAKLDESCKAGDFRPGLAEAWRKELRGLEASMLAFTDSIEPRG